MRSGGIKVSTKFSTWIFGFSLSTATLLILQHPLKLRYFKLRHDLPLRRFAEISSIVILVILQKLRSRCWSLGQERITLQIDISENSVRLEIFRYSSLWHEFTIAVRSISFFGRNLLYKADILRYFKFGYDFAISFRASPVGSILFSKSK